MFHCVSIKWCKELFCSQLVNFSVFPWHYVLFVLLWLKRCTLIQWHLEVVNIYCHCQVCLNTDCSICLCQTARSLTRRRGKSKWSLFMWSTSCIFYPLGPPVKGWTAPEFRVSCGFTRYELGSHLQEHSLCHVLWQCCWQCLCHCHMSLLCQSQSPKLILVKCFSFLKNAVIVARISLQYHERKQLFHKCHSITRASMPPSFLPHFNLSISYLLPSDLFRSKFSLPPCDKTITMEELKAHDKSNLLLRMYVKNQSFHFVDVKMVYRTVIIESASIFQCPICIYVYCSCMHKLCPLIQISN